MATDERAEKGDGALLAGAETGGLGIAPLEEEEGVDATEKEALALGEWVRRE